MAGMAMSAIASVTGFGEGYIRDVILDVWKNDWQANEV